MKRIIIDSGSTKADVAIIDKDHVIYRTHIGLNPMTQKALDVEDWLIQEIKSSAQLYFYGAGIVNDEQKKKIIHFFKVHNVALDVHAESDLLGACRATAKAKKAIICILGTGSNSCLYNGKTIKRSIPSLGYLIGDEGGAYSIGKSVMKQYFRGLMPQRVRVQFEKKYNDRDQLNLAQIYAAEKPNTVIANYAEFLNDVKGSWKKRVLNQAFDDFIENVLIHYKVSKKLPLFVVGTVARKNEKRLNKRLNKKGFRLTQTIQYPIKGLVKYHKVKEV